jgi:hypothetical protein
MRRTWSMSARFWLLALTVATASGGFVVARQRAASAMATSATAFLQSLTADQRQKAMFPLAAEERTRWNFVPTSMFPRQGLALREMTDAQRERAHALLQASLSQRGYATATAIIDLENVLAEIEGGRQGGPNGWPFRDPGQYYFSLFGTPDAKGSWGLRVEGHHLSLHFAVNGATAQISSTPAFFGSNPAEVQQGPKKGLRVLGAQEDTARALLDALTPEQRTKALVSPTAPGDVQTRTEIKVNPLTPAGLMATDMTAAQRELLMKIIDVFASTMADDVAADRLAKIKAAGIEKIGFAWAGSFDRGQRHHYRIQGPTFLIEQNNTQNNGNHVHSVWRDFNGDFGRDVLAEHLAAVRH